MRCLTGPSGALLVVVVVVATADPVASRAAVSLPTGFVDETLVSSLNNPAGMGFAPDGRLFICELRTGRMRVIVNQHVAATDPAGTVDSLTNDVFSERGLQSIAVDPRWPASPYVYVLYTHTGSREVIARYTASGDVTNPLGENITLGQKRTLIHDIRDQASNHNGGAVRFGPDGMLYVSLGEDADPCLAQTMSSLSGKLLRLDVSRLPAGGGGPVPKALLIPPDNPLSGPDSNTLLIYASGLRNPWRFHIDPVTGRVLLADVGDDSREEFNDIVAGGNYGWPFREGELSHSAGGCPDPGVGFEEPIYTLTHANGFTAVLTAGVYRPHATGTSNWPAIYHGNLFVGDYFNSRLRRLAFNGSTWSLAPQVPGQPNGSDWALQMYYSVDFAVGPDGSLWWLKATDDGGSNNSGSLRRIRNTSMVGVPIGGPSDISMTAAPNPFTGSVSFSIPASRDAARAIRIYDLAGRTVRSIALPGMTAGSRLDWDGRDELGSPAPAGLYFARLGTAEPIRLVKL